MYGRCWYRLACAVSALIVTAAGCNGTLSPEAKQLLLSGYASCNKGDDRATIRHMDEFLVANSRSRRANEAYYLRGLAKYHLKNHAGAKADLQAALSSPQHKESRMPALLAMGDLAYETDDIDLAAEMYRQALGLIGQGQKPSDHAHYRFGCVYQRQGRWGDADVQFSKVINFFRVSKLAGLARRRIHCIAWTVQAGSFERKANAERLRKKLAESALAAEVQIDLQKGRLLYLVQVGRYPSYERAASLLPRVKRHSSGAFVFVRKR